MSCCDNCTNGTAADTGEKMVDDAGKATVSKMNEFLSMADMYDCLAEFTKLHAIDETLSENVVRLALAICHNAPNRNWHNVVYRLCNTVKSMIDTEAYPYAL